MKIAEASDFKSLGLNILIPGISYVGAGKCLRGWAIFIGCAGPFWIVGYLPRNSGWMPDATVACVAGALFWLWAISRRERPVSAHEPGLLAGVNAFLMIALQSIFWAGVLASFFLVV